MCAGDMTPVPVKYYAPLHKSYVNSDVVHTCRNFQLLREWLSDRFDEEPDEDTKKLLREQ